jgi:uncharacterized membrane protein
MSSPSASGKPAEPSDVTSAKAKRKASMAPRSLRGRIAAGVLIIIPLAVTAILIRYVYNAALAVGVRLVDWVSRAVIWAFNLKREEDIILPAGDSWYENLIAIVLTVLMLYLLGWLGTNVVGRRVIDFVEGLVERIPLVATIYPAIRRMVQALSGAGKEEGSQQQVVLIDFPSEPIKAVAFMTNVLTDRATDQQLATVYLPTTPNPTSGYMLIVPLERITKTDWTMEEALSMILSGGANAKPNVRLYPPGSLAAELRRTSGKSSQA